MNDNERTNSDLTVVGLLFILLISLGLQIKTNYKVKYIEKELISTKNVVYYVSDELDNTKNQIDELNEDLVKLKNELYGLKEFKRITKELR